MTVILILIHLQGGSIALEMPMRNLEYCEAVAYGHNSYHRPIIAYCRKALGNTPP